MARKRPPKLPTIRVPVLVPGYHHQATIDGSDLEGSIDDAISALEGLRARYPDKKLILSWERVQYEDYSTYHLYEERPETAEEAAAREAIQNAHADRIKQMELETLERLKKKYPGT